LYTNPGLGYGLTGAELKLSFAGSGHIFGTNYYFTLEDGVRQYFGTTGPIQDRYNGTFGLNLDKQFKNQVSVSLGGFYSSSDFTKFQVNPALNKNFAFNQVSLSYGHSFSREFSVFLSGGTFINGRNTGAGSSASVSFIVRSF
jgi:protein XagA